MSSRIPLASIRPVAALAFLAAGGLAWGMGGGLHEAIWMAGLLLLGLPLLYRTGRGMLAGRFAADIVAALAVLVALLLRDPLPGLVVVLMQTGGEALELRAARRATRAVEALEQDAPRLAHVQQPDGSARTVPVNDVQPGMTLLVRPGELVPCDGEVTGGRSHVDRSRVAGEALPEVPALGEVVLSGTKNLDGALILRVLRSAEESTYAQIVALVRDAQASKAPLQRMADRYAVWFTPLTLLVCLAAWLASGDPDRVLAVLVVATPCPLLLAAPVAIIGGIDRGARQHIVFRHGGALEAISRIDTAVFDKTGTLTLGQPVVDRVEPVPGMDASELLALAAAVEEHSGHPLARSVVAAGRERGMTIVPASEVREVAGAGAEGLVDGRRVAVGSGAFVRARLGEANLGDGTDPEALWAWVAVDGRAAGRIRFADRVREGMPAALAELRRRGVREIILLSGDREAVAHAVGREAGVDLAHGEMRPQDKAAHVGRLVAAGRRVLMAGDGVNDAPALSAAQVGLAVGTGSGGIAAEAADVVLLSEDLAKIPLALQIGQETMRVARQSIWAGLGLSGLAMAVAAAGHIPPALGALLQEGIDVAVILNALRASR